ncbi:AI-2E family transporter [Clostridium saccharobutylicum]|uniref:Permease n=1 Tax=Clostridium saccharobutylicum DSM 13864 TaxID=1345695 RepID=U5MSU9_CLOSA|nr:AI-2E family transporter [Clostridium saccharobutylicum]AGX42507.1 permease [Clostridium saccharobutylicum DSM 13864]AQR89792.1 pheromone autoinducer 2 transporter [Clostridium saccharobutylicum]AQR99694.1 pheromone autoinducer 2 transporter [Clostridium saccharobutylicum]AQS13680.1 pheromone autoinducer 2 transporter [Clostridium saccharobutylicum]MBA2906693.1 putative PurR-regulated permease PerM [Clostridium saccharobutylicum]
MKIEFDKKLIKYAIYISITAIIIYIAFLIIVNIGTLFGSIISIIGNLISLINPLLIGIVIAYLLHPVTKLIERFFETNRIYKIKKASNRRVLAIFLSYLAVVMLLIGLIGGIYYMIGGQLSNNTTIINIFDYISVYLRNNSLTTASIKETLENTNLPFMNSIQPHIINTVTSIQNYLESNLGNLTSYIMSIGSSIASFFIAIVISIYLLKDSEYFINLWKKLYFIVFKKSVLGEKITYTFAIIHEVFGRYLRGQLLEAFFVGVLSAISLEIVGIKYSFVIGIISGICNMIPYVGPIVGTILAAIMGLLSGNPLNILYAIIAMLVVQQIDNHILAPKIVGDSVGLHAVFTMMAILIGGSVGGLLGMLLAVPITASVRVIFNDWYDGYIKKQNQPK